MEEENSLELLKDEVLFTVQMFLSKLDEDEMLGAITTFLSWEIAWRTLNIDKTLATFNVAVQDCVRGLLGIREWEDEI